MVKIAFKVDFLNSRVEFSPNCKVESKGNNPDKPVFVLDIVPTNSDKKYPVFSLSNNQVNIEEPEEEDKFWKGLLDLAAAPPASVSAPVSAPTPMSAPIPTYISAPASAPSYVPTPIPSPAIATPVPASISAPLPARVNAAPAPATVSSADVTKLVGQFESLKRMIGAMDAQFAAGKIPQDQYLQKKNFLGEQMGKLMGEMDSKGIPYTF